MRRLNSSSAYSSGIMADDEMMERGSHHSLVVDDEHHDEQQRATDEPYLKSIDFKELMSCLGFCVCCILPEAIAPSPNQRPIPYQRISTGEYVVNQVNAEELDGETISNVLLAVLAAILPFGIQFGIAWFYSKAGDAHATICVYLVAFGITMLTTSLVKIYVGYLRPVFYEVCQPNNDFSACTNNESDTRKSFPSGHASLAFCGLTLLTLFLNQRFGVPSQSNNNTANREHAFKYRVISVLCLAPMALAVFIAASRVFDNKHFPADVVAGSLLGASAANYVHGLWWVS